MRPLVQPVYSIRSGCLLVERFDYNLLLGWFAGLEADEQLCGHAVLSHSRQRLLNEEAAGECVRPALELTRPCISQAHFTVEGRLRGAWTSQKSSRPKGDPRSRAMRLWRPAPLQPDAAMDDGTQAQPRRKGKGQRARLASHGHVVVASSQGLVLEATSTAGEPARLC